MSTHKNRLDATFFLWHGYHMRNVYEDLNKLAAGAQVNLLRAFEAAGLHRTSYYKVKKGGDMKLANYDKVKQAIIDLSL